MMRKENNQNKNSFKMSLARVFDTNLHTHRWHNVVDYLIVGLIVISTVEVFLSTYDDIVEKYGSILKFIDWFTIIFFTIEVSLRIWTADISDEKYKGFWGRIRYCFTFYGLIDILSTYPFYLHFFMPMPYMALKVLRIFRLLRISRYMKSFSILGNAIASKKQELIVSVSFLTIFSIVLSFLLYFAEHTAQPDVCDNCWKTFVWIFAKYLGDPGGIADYPMITVWGQIISIIIGILGIAIFAIPVGLISSGFIEIIEKERKYKEIKNNTDKLKKAFERQLDRPTGFQVIPMYVSISEIMCRLKMSESDVFNALTNSDNFRLINLASTQPSDKYPGDRLAVEHFSINTEYGICIDRNSKVTIVSPSSNADPIIGNFSYYVAKIGGFNYVSRELGETRPYKSYYIIEDITKDIDEVQGLRAFMDDINRLTNREDSWCITLLASSGANEPEYPTQFHFGYGGKKGDTSYDADTLFIHDIPKFDMLYDDLSKKLKSEFGFKSDRQRYHSTSSKKNYIRHLEQSQKINAIVIRIAWSVTCWDMRRIKVAKLMSDVISEHLDGGIKSYSDELKKKDIGFSEYTEDDGRRK